jgi:hypothetical protein
MAYQATDSFVTEIDGAPVYVGKGEILPEGHPVLKALKGTHLFRSLVEEPEPAPARAARGKAS